MDGNFEFLRQLLESDSSTQNDQTTVSFETIYQPTFQPPDFQPTCQPTEFQPMTQRETGQSELQQFMETTRKELREIKQMLQPLQYISDIVKTLPAELEKLNRDEFEMFLPVQFKKKTHGRKTKKRLDAPKQEVGLGRNKKNIKACQQ